METKTIKLLLIEDDLRAAHFVRISLREGHRGAFSIGIGQNLREGLARLAQGGIEIVLLDLTLPETAGMDTFKAVKPRRGTCPSSS
jgi:DNA-binding response OmpR family regulator